jgi:hypothetical protein
VARERADVRTVTRNETRADVIAQERIGVGRNIHCRNKDRTLQYADSLRAAPFSAHTPLCERSEMNLQAHSCDAIT